jgi:hypothetical protein
MNFLLAIRILKKYGLNQIDIKILNRIQNDQRSYIQPYIEFNIYQILSYFIYNQLNITKKYFTINSGDLIINTNATDISINSKIILQPIAKNRYKEFLNSYICKSKDESIIIKNLNPKNKYLLFLSIDINILEKDYEIIKCNNYNFIFIENKKSVTIPLLNIYDKLINDCCLIEFQKFDDSTENVMNQIFNNPYFINKNKYLVGKLIAAWDREKLLTNILNEENNIKIDYNYCNVIGYSNRKDIDYIINNIQNKENTFYFYTPNMPLGLKWRHIAELNKILNTEYLLIQGSDDKILLNKINKEMITNHDFIGQHEWYIYNSIPNELYKFKLKYSVLRGGVYVIGAGRLIKKNQVARFNYNIFNPYRVKGLDYQMNCLAITIPNRLICYPICYSIKGDHKCFHQIDRYLTSKHIGYEKLLNDTVL